jgi:hypothetical protein
MAAREQQGLAGGHTAGSRIVWASLPRLFPQGLCILWSHLLWGAPVPHTLPWAAFSSAGTLQNPGVSCSLGKAGLSCLEGSTPRPPQSTDSAPRRGLPGQLLSNGFCTGKDFIPQLWPLSTEVEGLGAYYSVFCFPLIYLPIYSLSLC